MIAKFRYLDVQVIVDDSEGVTADDPDIKEWFESQFEDYEIWQSPAAGIAAGVRAGGGEVALENTEVIH